MCGRYSQVYSFEQLEAQLQIPLSSALSIPANYNVAHTQDAMVLTNEHTNTLQAYRWGLVPHWSKHISHGARLINARREGIATKRGFGTAGARTDKNCTPFRLLPQSPTLRCKASITVCRSCCSIMNSSNSGCRSYPWRIPWNYCKHHLMVYLSITALVKG